MKNPCTQSVEDLFADYLQRAKNEANRNRRDEAKKIIGKMRSLAEGSGCKLPEETESEITNMLRDFEYIQGRSWVGFAQQAAKKRDLRDLRGYLHDIDKFEKKAHQHYPERYALDKQANDMLAQDFQYRIDRTLDTAARSAMDFARFAISRGELDGAKNYYETACGLLARRNDQDPPINPAGDLEKLAADIKEGTTEYAGYNHLSDICEYFVRR